MTSDTNWPALVLIACVLPLAGFVALKLFAPCAVVDNVIHRLERWVGYAGYVLGGVVGAAVVIAVATELIAKHTWDQVLLGLCGTCRAMSCSTGATSA